MCYGQILESGMRQARKLHKCDVCRRPINSGERYHVAKTVDGREFSTTKECARCRSELIAVNAWGEYGDECVTDPREIVRELAGDRGWRYVLAETRKALARLLNRETPNP